MSRRPNREIAAIGVTIRGGDVGSGLPEHGGGPLRGGLTLLNRVTCDVADPAVPYDITMTVTAEDGWLVPESLTVSQHPGGPVMTSSAVRSLGLSLYVQRIRESLKDTPYIAGPVKTGDGWRSFDMPVNPGDLDGFTIAQLRRKLTLTPEMAADAYREALASADHEQNRRPTAAAAEKLGASRGHVSRLLTEARRKGLPGLGPSRPPRGNGSR